MGYDALFLGKLRTPDLYFWQVGCHFCQVLSPFLSVNKVLGNDTNQWEGRINNPSGRSWPVTLTRTLNDSAAFKKNYLRGNRRLSAAAL